MAREECLELTQREQAATLTLNPALTLTLTLTLTPTLTKAMRAHLATLGKTKPVVLLGDLNVALHTPNPYTPNP